ncbi:MAG: hypothetical protein QM789_21045 [Paenirhodobacter sp.]
MRGFIGRIVLTGRVTGHPNQSNTDIVTSQLFGIDAQAGRARTRNRWYRLGAPLVIADEAPVPPGHPDALPEGGEAELLLRGLIFPDG